MSYAPRSLPRTALSSIRFSKLILKIEYGNSRSLGENNAPKGSVNKTVVWWSRRKLFLQPPHGTLQKLQIYKNLPLEIQNTYKNKNQNLGFIKDDMFIIMIYLYNILYANVKKKKQYLGTNLFDVNMTVILIWNVHAFQSWDTLNKNSADLSLNPFWMFMYL